MNEVDSKCIPKIVGGDNDGDVVEEAVDPRIPLYPEGILPPNEKFDIPKFSGDSTNLTERRCVKLYNVWTVWSDLRRNERLVKVLEAKKRDSDDIKYLKAITTIAIDRLGKALADTNIVEELCVLAERREKETEDEDEDVEESLDHDGEIYKTTSTGV